MTQIVGKSAFLVNSGSRLGSNQFDSIADTLLQAGVRLDEMELVDDPSRFADKVQSYVDEGFRRLLIGGGDGTLNLAAGVLANKDVTMAVVPMGTGNQLARELEISKLENAIETIQNGRTIAIDTAWVNDHIFLNVATIGLSTEIANHLEHKQIFGKLTYGYATFRALKNAQIFRMEVQTEADRFESEFLQFVACNGRTHAGPFLSSPDASLFDGQIDCYGLGEMGPIAMAKTGLQAFTGHHVRSSEVTSFKSAEFTIKTTPQLPVTIDGEAMWFDTLTFKVQEANLHVRVPESFRCPENRIRPDNL